MSKNICAVWFLNLCYLCAGLKITTADTEDILYVVPVGHVADHVQVTQRNVDHLRANYSSGRVDVVFLHYDSKQDSWKNTVGAEWYKSNVQGSMQEAGGKFHLLQKYFTDESQMKKYAWIWAIDEDFDITGINIRSMMETAKASGSKIVAPTVKFLHKTTEGDGAVQAVEFDPFHNADFPKSFVKCVEGNPMCNFQAPQTGCKYRYSNFIEVMMPMFRPDALWQILTQCDHCIHEHSLWGLPNLWCKFVAAKSQMKDTMKACTLLDQHPAVKLVFHTLPTTYHSQADWDDAKKHNPKYWVDAYKRRSQCVQ
eukprot:gnl/MRDRNA2_/MRDRNA2_83688_c0_seq4.p1 gnl/MRDRNA2_/MRDRNA2_83688_c0~~gnl/MRDRNA2_/MRDRNA2_83688_c0_seq4.p1  ORF type:complete len:311 (+),score=39.82 gnl/MRDRNA2_/MRDRNA2_83688_c0_seq4:105-1037(+)